MGSRSLVSVSGSTILAGKHAGNLDTIKNRLESAFVLPLIGIQPIWLSLQTAKSEIFQTGKT